jgi:hypothetical protein
MVKRLDWRCAARPATTRIVANMNCRFCINAYTNSVGFRIRTGIYRTDVFKDLVSPFGFFEPWFLLHCEAYIRAA